MSGLAGRVVLVTGASRGIGKAIAERCETAGARVVGVGRSLPPRREERRVDVRCDITRADQVEALAREVAAVFGPPDAVVSSAGSFLLKPFGATTPAEFARELDTNLRGPFHVAREFLPPMKVRGSGRLITVGSVADHRAFPGNAAYGAAKFGLRGLHEVLREECRGSGVLCTLLSPGPTDTGMWDPYDPEQDPTLPPRAAMLCPGDVAEAVLWILTRPAHVDVEWIRMMPSHRE